MSNAAILKLKSELRTTTDLMDLMEVMKQVASAQFQGLQGKRPKGGRAPDAKRVLSLIEESIASIPPGERSHPFLEKRDRAAAPVGILMVTANEGFVGGLNSGIVQKGLLIPAGERAELVVTGERGRRTLHDLGQRVAYFPRNGSERDEGAVRRLRDHLVDLYLKGKVGRVLVVYARLASFARQEIESLQLLPYELPEGGPEIGAEVIIEPSAYEIIEYLVGRMIAMKIEEVFWQIRLAELAARTMYLETSTQTLADIRKKLRYQFFRAKHEATDTSIRETYAGLLMAE